MRPVVIAVGNPFRRDDGVAWLVADALEAGAQDGADTGLDADLERTDGEPTRLLELWAGRPLAVVVDAARGGPPGRVHRLDPGDLLPGSLSTTHGGGVGEALQLGAALDRAPQRLMLIAITGADFGHGPGCDPVVTGAVPAAAELVRRIVRREVLR